MYPKHPPSRRSNYLVSTRRQPQTCLNTPKVTATNDQKSNSKSASRTAQKGQLLLVYALIGLMVLVVVERIFIKDDLLLNFISSMFSLVAGYYFGIPKAK